MIKTNLANLAHVTESVEKIRCNPLFSVLGAWNKDWKPGPPPVTEEERLAAAEKYGMRPAHYVPFDPDKGV